MKKFSTFAVLLAALGVSTPRADEGKIPVFEPTTITAPGHYIVTQDFSSPGVAITIAVPDEVVLDLDGHTLTSTAIGCGGGSDVIVVVPDPSGRVLVRNGHLVGGCAGVSAGGFVPARIRLERLEIEATAGPGIQITPVRTIDLIDCHLHDIGSDGIHLEGFNTSFEGRILRNKIERVGGYGIALIGLHEGEVRSNVVADFGSAVAAAAGILLTAGAAAWESGGNRVEANEVMNYPSGGALDDDGIRIEMFSPNNFIVGNLARQNGRYGIWSDANDTRIERNVASQNTNHGILVGPFGRFNHLDRNQTQFNIGAGACGIALLNGPTHAYGNNNFSGPSNSAGGLCDPFGNTDLLHNVFP